MCINNYNNVIKLIDWFNTDFLSLFEENKSKHKHKHKHFEEVPKNNNHIIIQIDEDPDDLIIHIEEIKKNEQEYDYYTWDIL
jgi:hypothetical protein